MPGCLKHFRSIFFSAGMFRVANIIGTNERRKNAEIAGWILYTFIRINGKQTKQLAEISTVTKKSEGYCTSEKMNALYIVWERQKGSTSGKTMKVGLVPVSCCILDSGLSPLSLAILYWLARMITFLLGSHWPAAALKTTKKTLSHFVFPYPQPVPANSLSDPSTWA